MLFREQTNDAVGLAVECEGVFSDEECLELVEWANAQGFTPGVIRTKDGVELDTAIRVADEVRIPMSAIPNALEDSIRRIGSAIAKLNHEHWRFDITRLSDAGVIRYTEGQHFLLHTDLVAEHSDRKLGVIVQLADDEAYAGGDLEYGFSPSRVAGRKRGTLIVFPSWMPHRVSPVVRGVRYSLALFALGPAFR